MEIKQTTNLFQLNSSYKFSFEIRNILSCIEDQRLPTAQIFIEQHQRSQTVYRVIYDAGRGRVIIQKNGGVGVRQLERRMDKPRRGVDNVDNRLIDNGRACNPKLRLELETSDFEQYVLRDAIRKKFEVVQ